MTATITPVSIWRALREEDDLHSVVAVPWAKETVKDFITEFTSIYAICLREFDALWYAETEHRTPEARRHYIMKMTQIAPPAYWPIMLALYDGQPIRTMIWDLLRPEDEEDDL